MSTPVSGDSARDTRNEDAKREILKRIRDAQQLSNAPESVEIVRNYHTSVSYTHLTLPTNREV